MQGIYSYTNIINGKIYVGQSSNLYIRPLQHKHLLKKGKDSLYFQRAVDKYGIDKFVYEEIVCGPFDKEDLIELEQFYMDMYKTEGKILYNICPAAGSTAGIKHSKETKQIWSKQRKGKKFALGHKCSEQAKSTMAEQKKGIKNPNFGKPLLESHRNKISLSMMGNKNASNKIVQVIG
jgi:group I intron endonuclease